MREGESLGFVDRPKEMWMGRPDSQAFPAALVTGMLLGEV